MTNLRRLLRNVTVRRVDAPPASAGVLIVAF